MDKILNLKLVDEYDDILVTPTAAWDFSAHSLEDLLLICQSMIYRMVADGGLGLAANQVGLNHSIFVLGSNGNYAAVINPEILETHGEQVEMEGCLSAPGLYLKVKRAAKIKVRFYAIDGKVHEQEYTGLTAQVFQHEFDHLQGIRFQDKVSPILLSRAKAKVKQNIKRIRAARAYALEMAEQERLAANAITEGKTISLTPDQITNLESVINETQASPEAVVPGKPLPPVQTPGYQSPIASGTVLDFSTTPAPQPAPQPTKPAMELDFVPST